MTASSGPECDPQSIATMRKEYRRDLLDESSAASDPIVQFAAWFGDASAAGLLETNAMTVATVATDGTPSVRTVLLKGLDERGFVFYTNDDSQKGTELTANPHVALLFYWPALERQVRVTGLAERISGTESDEYFRRRPLGSQLGAVSSPQSSVVPDRAWLAARYDEAERQAEAHGEVVRPAFWGGVRVAPGRFEFWQGRPNRLHDRLVYQRADTGDWRIERLAP